MSNFINAASGKTGSHLLLPEATEQDKKNNFTPSANHLCLETSQGGWKKHSFFVMFCKGAKDWSISTTSGVNMWSSTSCLGKFLTFWGKRNYSVSLGWKLSDLIFPPSIASQPKCCLTRYCDVNEMHIWLILLCWSGKVNICIMLAGRGARHIALFH